MTMFASHHPIRGAIIDLDGTMLDTVPDFHVAINRMRAGFGLAPIAPELIARMVGKGSENLIRGVLALDFDEAGVGDRIAAAMDAYQHHYIAINGDHSTLYPDVVEGLTALREMGLALACVTNKPMAFAQPLLARKGLSHFFDVLYGGDSFERRKPDPMPLLGACASFSLRPSEVVAIGDSVRIKVLDIDRDRQRISLGLKQTQEDPWQRVINTHRDGDVLEGTVTKVVAFGAFVEILPGVEGLLHISELQHGRTEKTEDVVKKGDIVQVKLLEVDDRGRMKLSRKALLPKE